jgi:hypothetical protein
MFHYGLPSFLKQSAHADDRLAERTNVPQSVLDQLRRDIKKSPIPHGDHHVTLEDGSFAVLKDVGRGGEKRHVVATVLSPSMSPPGTDVTEAVSRETPNTRSAVYTSAGPRAQQRGGSHIEQKVYRDRGTLSAQEGHERSERIRDRIRNVRARSESRVSRAPGSFSESHSYSSVEKVAFTGALIGGAVAGGDAKQRAVGAAGGQLGSATIGNIAMAGGLYAAHKAGYTQPLLKNTAFGTFKNIAAHPVESVKALGTRGGTLIAVPTVLGTVGGAYVGSKMAVQRYKDYKARAYATRPSQPKG